MAGLVPFLVKDFVLLAVSIYLLKQDVVRLLEARPSAAAALSEARLLVALPLLRKREPMTKARRPA